MVLSMWSKVAPVVVLVAGVAGMATATLSFPLRAEEQTARSEAEQIATRILKAGSDLFDAKNAAALAATYAEDATIHMISKPEDEPYKDDVKHGRTEIEQFYQELFKDSGAIDSENMVDYARLIAPDLLVVHGRFRPNTDQKAIPFVQMRIKRGEDWLMRELWLFLSSGPE